MAHFQKLSADIVENFFQNFARPGDVVFDVGANLGQSAYAASKVIGANGRVYSFEPSPVAYRVLLTNIQRLKLTNVTPVEMALSDRNGVVDFFVDMRPDFTSQGSSLRELNDLKAQGKTKKTSVKCLTLDTYCEQHSVTPKLLKIDVESFEPQVIAGGKNIIESKRPIILFEFWETWWSRGFKELFEYLAPMYTLVRMQDDVNVERWYHDNTATGLADILCLPR